MCYNCDLKIKNWLSLIAIAYIRHFNKILNKTPVKIDCKEKWNAILNIEINENTWKDIFTVAFRTIQDNHYKWFQYWTIQRILGTHALLYKQTISDNSQCRLCHSEVETIEHLFLFCRISNDFWRKLCDWILLSTK